MSQDLHPTGINVYGYAVAWVPAGATAWQMEPDDEYRNLPAHYPTLAEANKYVAGEWKRAHAPQKLLQWVGRYHAWERA